LEQDGTRPSSGFQTGRIIRLSQGGVARGIHEAQLLTYMKLAGVKTGLLINFNVTRLKTGIKRFVL
jgi:GxxExxY protein